MKVKELCDGYRALTAEAQKTAYLEKNIKVRKYLPFAEKKRYAILVVNASNLNEKDEVVLDSPKQYLTNVFALMEAYTDLELNSDAWVEDYDQLNELGLINRIIMMIPETELTEFDTIRNMVYSDFLENQASLRSWLGRKLEGAKKGFEAWLDKAVERLDKVDWNELQTKLMEMQPKDKK